MITKECINKRLKWLLLIFNISLLSGCNCAILNPKGLIGLEQRFLIIISFILMLIVVIPVIFMTVSFVWKYRENSNNHIDYDPNWGHSKKIETIVWTIPVLIITFLAILTWKTTHLLEPSNPLVHSKKPITIEVISMDWKWLFIYPEHSIASINEIAFPVDNPVKFKVTSNSVMNSFFVPQLGSQIYTMAGMQTKLHLIANESGIYDGISSSYSGRGFSGMKFKVIVTRDVKAFHNWVRKARQSPNTINNMDIFEKLALPSEYNKVEYFSNIKPGLFEDIVNKFMKHNKT